jgi:putative NIF3 family GTP cyclohydrolase 1 type 2
VERTVQEIIDTIIAAVPGAPFADTVDTLKTGDPQQKVNVMATTFLATSAVIEQAIERGANLIITHEPTFYSHTDETHWLEGDLVYEAKRRLIEEHHLAIWRFHDYLHSLQPDPTISGLLKALGWTTYASSEEPFVCQLPPRTLADLVLEIKSRLGLTHLCVIGDLQMTCQKVGILVGAIGGEMQIKTLGRQALDVLVCGEINEWETNEYVRDAMHLEHPKALIVTGHSVSEEDGMREIIPWLEARLPGLPITFIPTGHALHTM